MIQIIVLAGLDPAKAFQNSGKSKRFQTPIATNVFRVVSRAGARRATDFR
jgi:hypothetical protein